MILPLWNLNFNRLHLTYRLQGFAPTSVKYWLIHITIHSEAALDHGIHKILGVIALQSTQYFRSVLSVYMPRGYSTLLRILH